MYGRCVHEWTDVQIGIKEWMDVDGLVDRDGMMSPSE